MTALRTFLSIPLAALAAMSLMGCYDLSTSGPTPNDFMRPQSPTQTEDQGQQGQAQTQAEVRDAVGAEAEATSSLLDAIEEQDQHALVEARSKIRVPDAD
jgi:hypothetical protein